jgi:hypothetical protein
MKPLSVPLRGYIQKFPDLVDNKTNSNNKHSLRRNTKIMAAKLTRLTHRIAIQLHLVAESCTICSSSSRRPIRKFLFTPSYADCNPPNKCYFFLSSDGFLEVLISVELTHNEAASELWTVIDFSFLFRDLPGTNRKPFFHLFPI